MKLGLSFYTRSVSFNNQLNSFRILSYNNYKWDRVKKTVKFVLNETFK